MDMVPSNDNYTVDNARLAVSTQLQYKRALGQPISRFNKKTGLVYLEFADGHIQEIGYAMKNGHYGQKQREEA